MEALVAIRTGGFLTTETEMEVPPNSLQREEVNNNDLGRWSPWWGGRQEGTSDLQHSWSQFLVGFIHPVRWHPPDDGRQSGGNWIAPPVSTQSEDTFGASEGGAEAIGANPN